MSTSLPDLSIGTSSVYTQPIMLYLLSDQSWSAPATLTVGTRIRIGLCISVRSATALNNVRISLFADGYEFYRVEQDCSKGNRTLTFTCGNFSFNPGTHVFTLKIDPQNQIGESDESNNVYTYTVNVPGSTDWLIRTDWGQDNRLLNTDVTINQYAPIDPKTGERCISGCTNTADVQVLYYFALLGYHFLVELKSSDAYTSGSISINATAASADQNGTLSFAQINALLEDFDTSSAEDIAALTYAAGILNQSTFGSAATSTYGLGEDFLTRAGFTCQTADQGSSPFWTGSRRSGYTLSDSGWNMLIENISSKKPVIASIPGHALVIDGYDAAANAVHLNYGWKFGGGKYVENSDPQGSGWYTRSECGEINLNAFLYDITPDTTAPVIDQVLCSYQNNTAVLRLQCSDAIGIWKKYYRLSEDDPWQYFSSFVRLDHNAVIYFRVCDNSQNYSDVITYTVNRIAEPIVITAKASTTELTRENVLVTAEYSPNVEFKQYSFDETVWLTYLQQLVITQNTVLHFRGIDYAGNVSETVTVTIDCIDNTPPEIPAPQIQKTGKGTATLTWEACCDTGSSGLQGYFCRVGKTAELSGAGEFTQQEHFDLSGLADGEVCYYQVRALDRIGNISAWSAVQSWEMPNSRPVKLQSDGQKLCWQGVSGTRYYELDLSGSDGKKELHLQISGSSADTYARPADLTQWQVCADATSEWSDTADLTAVGTVRAAQVWCSDEDGEADLFFARPTGIWGTGVAACHAGSCGGWSGTGEVVALRGRNRFTDLYRGGSDANVLLLTDDAQGDALFLDDLASAFPEEVSQSCGRLDGIQEIRSGAGNDFVDLTSARFTVSGSGLTIRGGDGSDILWAGHDGSALYGDAGDDRLTGGSGDDLLAGGSGNDRLYGGGGNDLFTFCENWGSDCIEQLAGGTVTLWFLTEEGSWDPGSLTYTQGDNSVRVSGIDADSITLCFGSGDDPEKFSELAADGAFLGESSAQIYEKTPVGVTVRLG